jgi:hypothetical protein
MQVSPTLGGGIDSHSSDIGSADGLARPGRIDAAGRPKPALAGLNNQLAFERYRRMVDDDVN